MPPCCGLVRPGALVQMLVPAEYDAHAVSDERRFKSRSNHLRAFPSHADRTSRADGGSVASGELTYFVNRVDNFIFRQLSGAIEDDLFETFFVQGDAKLQGIESHIDVRVAPIAFLEGGIDYVRGDLTSIDKPLTRMPPLRGRAGLRLQKNAFQAGVDGVFTAKQDRIYTIDTPQGSVGESATDGYNLLKLYTSYSFVSGKSTNTITARLDNATDTLYRNHLNYLKDLAPEMGRSLRVVYSVKFQ